MQNRPMTGTTPRKTVYPKRPFQKTTTFPGEGRSRGALSTEGAAATACARSRKSEFQSGLEPSGSGRHESRSFCRDGGFRAVI